jgi:hypothetical protein
MVILYKGWCEWFSGKVWEPIRLLEHEVATRKYSGVSPSPLPFFITPHILVVTSCSSNLIAPPLPHLTWQPITAHSICYTKTHLPVCIVLCLSTWPMKVGPTDGPETLVTKYQLKPRNILQVQRAQQHGIHVSMAFMLRIQVFWVVMVNSRVTDSWCSKRTSNLIFRGSEVLRLNPYIPRCYVPPNINNQ